LRVPSKTRTAGLALLDTRYCVMTSSSQFRERLSRLRSALFYWPMTILCTLLLEPLSIGFALVDRSGRMSHRVVAFWSGLLLKLYGMTVTVEGLERLDLSRPHLYAANHLSALDIPLIYRYLPFQFRIIAHRVVFRVPLVGWHLRATGQLMIDSESVSLSRRAIREAVRTLERGMPLVVFPEGERSPNGRMQPFRRGAFYVAAKAQVDVVPIAILGTYEAFPKGSAHLRPGPLRLIIGDALPPAGYTSRDVDALAEHTQRAVAELCHGAAKPQVSVGSSKSPSIRCEALQCPDFALSRHTVICVLPPCPTPA
jgi:1-acyl-sn-glycerol-3-phosphate acyltransferase